MSDQVCDILVDRLATGAYRSGEHLNELDLCRQLDVSRTPVREALFKLESRGLLESKPNRGFFVPPLLKGVVRNHYPILAALDALALKTSRPFTTREIEALEAINKEMADPRGSPPELFQLDLDFHQALIDKCENRQLLTLIDSLKAQTRRFDGSYKRGLANRARAHEEHLGIIALLKAGDNAGAAGLLEEHWLGGIDIVNEWIDNQDP